MVRRPGRKRRQAEGFTLIELLVVIAILALLLAIMFPALTRARDLTRFALCRANFRNTAAAFHGFASDHNGRFPGMAHSSVEYWTVCWPQILNREFYHAADRSVYPTSGYGDEPTCGPLLKFWTFWDASQQYYNNGLLHKKWVTCPNYQAWGAPPGYSNNWSRPWIMNGYAAGGGYSAPVYGGQEVVPPSRIHPNYDQYVLGAKQESFRNPAGKYLIWDSERGSDYSWGGSTGTVQVGVEPDRPPWTGSTGIWSFRHLVPVDRRMYQANVRGNVLFVDGHAGILNPNEPMALTSKTQAAL